MPAASPSMETSMVRSGLRSSFMSLAIFLSSGSVMGTKPQLSDQASLKISMPRRTSRSRFLVSMGRQVTSGRRAISSAARRARGETSPGV